MRIAKIDHRPAAQTLVAPGRLIEVIGKAVTVLRLGEPAHAVANGLEQHAAVLEVRQVQIARKIFHELPDRDMLAPPQRNPVELHPEAVRGKAAEEKLVAAQLPAGADSQDIRPRKPQRLPGDGSLRRVLHRRQQPLVGLGKARRGLVLNVNYFLTSVTTTL